MSVIIIARNEEKNLRRVLESVKWADEICLMDTGSRDGTMKIAGGLGARVSQAGFRGFGEAKQAAAAMASHDWLFSIDCDEKVTPVLRRSIENFLKDPGDFSAAEVCRLTNFCGKWIIYSGWYPEYVLRLFNKNQAAFNDRYVHEGIETDGKVHRLCGHLLHYSYPNLFYYFRKIWEYAHLGALQKQPKPFFLDLLSLLFKPPFVFVKKFVFQLGFFNGLEGLWIAGMTAFGQILKYYFVLAAKKPVNNKHIRVYRTYDRRFDRQAGGEEQ